MVTLNLVYLVVSESEIFIIHELQYGKHARAKIRVKILQNIPLQNIPLMPSIFLVKNTRITSSLKEIYTCNK